MSDKSKKKKEEPVCEPSCREEPAQASSEAQVQEEELSETERLSGQIAELEEQLEKEKKEYLFLMADFDNFRKRTLKEKSELIRNGAEGAMRGILPIIDDFERALAVMENTDDTSAIKQGLEIIYNKFLKYIDQNGVKEIQSDGSAFDTELHEAVAMVPTEEENLKGKVIDTIEKGYTLNDKVIRHAKVAVGE